jgi:hypothetical protein
MGCFYRFNALFNVPKKRAAVISILCFSAAVPFLFMGEMAMISFMFVAYGLIYGGIWLFKSQRDKQAVERTKVTLTQPQEEVMSPMANPDSYRLFVPGHHPEM